mmetsp:Transcript_25316/g.59051  ORF Transcript_25316/g.59051 Transcript_25316/m.59051 type:complete len:382 (+) Transcript_25316:1690-2835(+)
MVHLGAHAVEEVRRVRGEQQDGLPLGEVILQPHARAKVEVVGRLVEHEQHRLHKERLREGDAHAPAARHVLGRLVHHLLAEAEAEEQLARALLEGARVHLVELLVDRLEPRVLRPVLRHDLLLELLEALLLQPHRVNHHVDRRTLARRALVVQEPDVDEVGDRDHPRRDALEQRRLARAVLRDQPVPVAVGELELLVLKEDLAEERDREGGDLDVARVLARCEVTCAHRQLVRAVAELELVESLGGFPAFLLVLLPLLPLGLLRRLLLLRLDRLRLHRAITIIALALALVVNRLARLRCCRRLLCRFLRGDLRLLGLRRRLLLLLAQLLLKELLLPLVNPAKRPHPLLLHALALLVRHLRVQLARHRERGRLGGPILPRHN